MEQSWAGLNLSSNRQVWRHGHKAALGVSMVSVTSQAWHSPEALLCPRCQDLQRDTASRAKKMTALYQQLLQDTLEGSSLSGPLHCLTAVSLGLLILLLLCPRSFSLATWGLPLPERVTFSAPLSAES